MKNPGIKSPPLSLEEQKGAGSVGGWCSKCSRCGVPLWAQDTLSLVLRPLGCRHHMSNAYSPEEGVFCAWGSDRRGGGSLQPAFRLQRTSGPGGCGWRARVHSKAGHSSTGPLTAKRTESACCSSFEAPRVSAENAEEARAWGQTPAARGARLTGTGNGEGCAPCPQAPPGAD